MKLEGISFKARSNTKNGSIGSETIMNFESENDIILGNYSGGTVLYGQVLAKRVTDSTLDMLYQGATSKGEIQAGRAKAVFIKNEAGDLEMHLDWHWLTGDGSRGKSEWVQFIA